MFKKITKYIFIVLLMVIAIPVFSKELVSLEKITGKTDNEEVVLNATDSIDLSFNDLNQKATYKVKLKNNTDDVLYVNDLITEDLSEAKERRKNLDKLLNYDRYSEEVETVTEITDSAAVASPAPTSFSDEDIRPTSTTMQFGEDIDSIREEMNAAKSEEKSAISSVK